MRGDAGSQRESTVAESERSERSLSTSVLGAAEQEGMRTLCDIQETAGVDEECKIGSGMNIWHYSHVLKGCRIGDNCNIGQTVVIRPGVTLEDGVFCGPSMVFTNAFNPRAEIRKMEKLRSTLFRRGATIGANATIVCGHTIGEYAFVGAGAVVTKDVTSHSLVTGNPARHAGWVCRCGE